jgi:chloramphenicol 3-O phosphotransferase
MKTLFVACFSFFAWLNVLAAPGLMVLLNGTSSAGKSSLAEVMVRESGAKYEVVSFDDFYRAYLEKNHLTRMNLEQHEDFLLSFYRHARERSDMGKNVIIDTVEFDRAYDRYCDILNCSNVIKAVVYCPPQHLLKRIEKRNNSGDPSSRRPVLLAFQQFLELYKPQTSPEELVVEKTSTRVIRAALEEAGKKAGNTRQYQALYKDYIRVFGIDKDRESIIVVKGKYDLVINTRANSKQENVRLLEGYLGSRRQGKGHLP